MKTGENKSLYDRLYLIPVDMYNRVIPYLNDVDKQEVNDLSEKHRPFQGNDENFEEKNEEQKNDTVEEVNDTAEEVNDNAEEINDDVIMDSPEKNEEVNIDNPATPVEEPKKPKISVKLVKQSNGDWSIKKKVKNFSCEICVNKRYTTK